MEPLGLQRAKTIEKREEEKKTRGLILLHFKTYYKATVIMVSAYIDYYIDIYRSME